MASTNKTSLGLNKWEASDKPVRQDFVNDNIIVDEKISKLNSDLASLIGKMAITSISSAYDATIAKTIPLTEYYSNYNFLVFYCGAGSDFANAILPLTEVLSTVSKVTIPVLTGKIVLQFTDNKTIVSTSESTIPVRVVYGFLKK